jgi:hypothetical protein
LNLINAILGLVLVIAGLLISLMLIDEPAFSTGLAHELYTGMNTGGDGLERLGDAVGRVGWLGAAIMLLMALMPALGVRAERRSALFWVLMTVVMAAGQWVWWSMYLGYLDFLRSGEPNFVLSFPAATSWMLYGVWLAGSLLSLIYIFGFRRFILSHEDEAEYEALRAEAEIPRVMPDVESS